MKGKIEKTEIPKKNGTHVATCVHGSALSVTYKYFFALETRQHTSSSLPEHPECYGNEAWKCASHNFFHNISTKCTRDSAFSIKKKKRRQKKKKKTAEKTVNTPQFTPFQNYTIRSERVGSGVSAPRLEWC